MVRNDIPFAIALPAVACYKASFWLSLLPMGTSNVLITEVEQLSLNDIKGLDFSFEITAELMEPYENPFQDIKPVNPYWKTYHFDARQFRKSKDQNLLIAVAKQHDRLCGYILVRKSWNNYALINDFAVDQTMRRYGVGRQLMDKAVEWAKARQLPGIWLETQSNNVAACQFYKNYGFILGGFDKCLYSAIKASSEETALFWYLIFK